MSRKATKEEMEWWLKLMNLVKKMPKTMKLFADGSLVAIDTEESKNYGNLEHFQPITNLYRIPGVDGGEPWK
jgi:hypothetical protein